jgi:hypothetical protein
MAAFSSGMSTSQRAFYTIDNVFASDIAANDALKYCYWVQAAQQPDKALLLFSSKG